MPRSHARVSSPSLLRCLVIPALGMSAVASAKAPPAPTIDAISVWADHEATPADGTRAPDAARTVPFQSLDWTAESKFDLQYEADRRYQLVPLDEVLAAAQKKTAADLAVLRFQNGMAIPVPLKPDGRLSVPLFLARATKTDRRWSRDFPALDRSKPTQVDRRPIRFYGNKVIYGGPKRTGFTPYRYANSLKSIVLVKKSAYEAKFRPEKPSEEAIAGQRVFLANCQFCHALDGHGGTFGWDFSDPLPVSAYRKSPTSLYYHVHYREKDAPNKGLLMPALRHISPKDIDQLWAWLAAHGQNRPQN